MLLILLLKRKSMWSKDVTNKWCVASCRYFAAWYLAQAIRLDIYHSIVSLHGVYVSLSGRTDGSERASFERHTLKNLHHEHLKQRQGILSHVILRSELIQYLKTHTSIPQNTHKQYQHRHVMLTLTVSLST